MRYLQILVPDEHVEAVTDTLAEEKIDYVRQRAWHNGDEEWIVECPVPTDAVRYVLDRLTDAGIEEDRYTTVGSLESAMAPGVEGLEERFADDFDPLRRNELRSKARDIARDRRSFLAMVLLSAVIAVAGLLIESTTVVVGSMVIAPLVGPVLTAAVGAVTNDREMLLNSVWLQSAGLVVAVGGGAAFSFALQWLGFFPGTLDVSAIDLIALRIAPNFVAIAIGLAAGAAGAYGLMTKGPTSLIGVMIAAALIPAAATVGIATAWGQYRIAAGSLLLLVLSVVLINVGAYAVLRWYYRPREPGWLATDRRSWKRGAVIGTAIAIVAVLAVVGAASFQQITFERSINTEIEETLQTEQYANVELVTARIQYAGRVDSSPPTVTVLVSRSTAGRQPPDLADTIDRRITRATGREVHVQVRFREYQQSDPGATSQSLAPDASYGGRWLASPSPAHYEWRKPRYG